MTRNIWYVHPYAGGPGIGRYTRPYSLAKYWTRMGVNATVFTVANHHQLDTPRPAGPLSVNGIPYEFISCRAYTNNGIGRLLNMADLTRNLWRYGNAYAKLYGKPDLIISSSPHPYAFLATHHLARRFKAKSIFEVRDLWPLGFVELLGTSKYHPLVLFTAWLERYAYKHADAVVSLLPKTKPYMVEHGLAEKKWHHIPNGVDLEINNEVSSDGTKNQCIEQAQAFKNQGYITITYTGALGQPNYVESLIEALALAKQTSNAKLAAIIVGRGEAKINIERLVHKHQLQASVAVFDQISKHDTLQLLRAVDIGYISLKPGPLFGFGISPNKLFDYMLAGLPVLFSISAGNNPVQDANCGISTAPNNIPAITDALIKLASLNKDERTTLGENGKQYVIQRHSYSHLAENYLRLLSDI